MFDDYCLVDVETTGGSPITERIIEIAVIRVVNGEIVEEFKTLINPGVNVPVFIHELTGITQDELYVAPAFEEVAEKIFDILDGAVFIAHNVGFDYAFVKNEFRRIGLNYNSKIFCTARLSRSLFPEYSHHNLAVIIERLGIEVEARHRAYDDAKVLYDFIKFVENSVSQSVIDNAKDKILKTPYSNPLITDDELNVIPEKCGVYIFYSETGMPLYIGKSVNLKKRVMDHLRGIYFDSKEFEIWSQVAKIDYRTTPGEISALILESDLIKEMMPVYNKALRKKLSQYFVVLTTSQNGQKSLEISRDEISDMEGVVGIFKTAKRAKEFITQKCEEFGLCKKLLGLEAQTIKPKACFAYQLDKCCGVCIDESKINDHNARMGAAFDSNSYLKKWPYKGPTLFKEADHESGEYIQYKIDNWKIVSAVTYFGEELVEELLDKPFEYDTYKILVKAIGKRFP